MRLVEGAVVIRNFEIDDIQRKIRWINDSRNNEYLHYEIPLTLEKTKNWFLNKDNSKRYDCVIEYAGIPVGLIGLLALDKVNNKAEFYISMGEQEYKKKGIATTATKLLLKFAFDQLKLHKVYLNVDEANMAACRLYEKAGFNCEGIFVDDLVKKSNYINRKRYAVINPDKE